MITWTFPDGKRKALTFSYDDGPPEDRRLVEILNRHGMKGTFNLNSRNLHSGGKNIQANELRELYADAGHEVAVHGFEHPFEDQIPRLAALEDLRRDREFLEDILGKPIVGMAYPFGTYSNDLKAIMRALGIVYARTVTKAPRLQYIPEDWLEWHPSGHHNEATPDLAKNFLTNPWGLQLCYIWGHSYEFPISNNWHVIEDFCAAMSENQSVWCATNLEIFRYVSAARELVFSVSGRLVTNPSAIPVSLVENEVLKVVQPGQTLRWDAAAP